MRYLNLVTKYLSRFIGKDSASIASDDIEAAMMEEENPEELGGDTNEEERAISLVSIKDFRARATPHAVISRRENIPGFKKVLTMPKGELPLPESMQRYYVALLLHEKHRTIQLIASVDAPKTNGIDHYLMTLRERVKTKGYRNVPISYATSNVIQIIYEEASKIVSAEEEAKETSELENDYDDLLLEAVDNNISDIHIEVRRDSAVVRWRKDGILIPKAEWPVQYARRFAMVIYQVIAEEKDVTFKEHEPQDAVVDRELGHQRVRVRLATQPGYPDGFDMVMRILPMGVGGKRKDDFISLGYNQDQIDQIEKAISKPVGVVIMAGTTGSGKSTTLKTMVGAQIEMHNGQIKVITVEDPPEYLIQGATQVPVVRSRTKESGKNPFAAAIRAAMRSDPDILMIGEVRDEDSAELLVHAVQSGHQAFTTVHASSAIDIIGRLRSLKVPPDVLGSPTFISGLVYQTLVPILCKKCAITMSSFVSANNDDRKIQALIKRIDSVANGNTENIYFRNHVGCSSCNSGAKGRTVCAEVVLPDATMIQYFGASADLKATQYYAEQGGRTALMHGISKMLAGICDPIDIEFRLGRLGENSIIENKSVENTAISMQ